MINESNRTGFHCSHPIWNSIPSTIEWLQGERNKIRPSSQTASDIQIFQQRYRGLNATIILLSASCIEGFLVDCLESFTMGYQFSPDNTVQGRLNRDLLNRISKATFKEFPDLFRLLLGKPISELIRNDSLIEGIGILRDFRNGIAHARAFKYQTCSDDVNDHIDYEIDNQYRNIHKYLENKSLVRFKENIFKNEVADHFAGLVKPYIDAVVPLLPDIQSDNIKAMVKYAYTGSMS